MSRLGLRVRLLASLLVVASCAGEPGEVSTSPEIDASVADGAKDRGQRAEDRTTAGNDVALEAGADTAGSVASDGGGFADVGGSADGGTLIDARGSETGDGATAACPLQPDLDLTWMGDYERDVIARLTGDAEVAPGLKLANRGTATTRTSARAYLDTALRALKLAPLQHTYATGANVYARLDGTGAEHVVLGAHFDSVPNSPGANDNATGVALVLAAGRALAQLGCRARPVLLVFFDEEEKGLVGAKQFAGKLAADRTAVHSVHTADQLGWDSNGDRLLELELPDAGLRSLYEEAQRSLGLTFPIVTTTTTGSDHSAFRPNFRAVGLTEGYRSGDTSPHRHKPTDTFATVNFDYLRSATTLVVRVMSDLVR